MARRITRYKAPYASLLWQNPAWKQRMDQAATQIANNVLSKMRQRPVGWTAPSAPEAPGAVITPVPVRGTVRGRSAFPPQPPLGQPVQQVQQPWPGNVPPPQPPLVQPTQPPVDENTFFTNIVAELRNRFGQDLDNETVRQMLFKLRDMGLNPGSSLQDIDRMMKALGGSAPTSPDIFTDTGEIDVNKLRDLLSKSGGFRVNVGFNPFSWGGFTGLGGGLAGAAGYAAGTVGQQQQQQSPSGADPRLELMKKLRIIKYLRAHGVDLFPGYATGTSQSALDRLNKLLSQRRPLR